MESDGIEEISVRLLGSSASGGGGESRRWVDGSEVDSDSPPWSFVGDEEGREGFGSVRRRLVKKPKRVDSFDVEAMEIAASHGHHHKVCNFQNSTPSMCFTVCVQCSCVLKTEYWVLLDSWILCTVILSFTFKISITFTFSLTKI